MFNISKKFKKFNFSKEPPKDITPKDIPVYEKTSNIYLIYAWHIFNIYDISKFDPDEFSVYVKLIINIYCNIYSHMLAYA